MDIFANGILEQDEIEFKKITNLKERYGKQNDLGSELMKL